MTATMTGPDRTWAVIAGGGTGGHVVPGLAIASEMVARGAAPRQVHFIGSRRGLERRLVPAAGFPLTALPGRGIQRRVTPANLTAALGLIVAVVRALVIVGRLRPAVLVGLGGYASVPGVLAAVVWRVPIVVAEQNAVPSAANRLAGRFARAAAVPFPDTDLPNATWTGNPVRAEIAGLERTGPAREAACARLALDPDRRVVAAFGGSLGARRINEAVLGTCAAWRHRGDLAVRHIAGERDHDDLAARRPVDGADPLQYQLVGFEDDMVSVYAAAEVVVCRAGASSGAEIAVVGIPSVLIPLPGAPGDHQTANARRLADANAAVMIPDAELDPDRLRAELETLLADPDRLASMAAAARTLGRPDAASAVVDLVEAHARRPLPTPTLRRSP